MCWKFYILFVTLATKLTCYRLVFVVCPLIASLIFTIENRDTCNVSIDWQTRLAHITGAVKIYLVMHTLAKSGYKAEVVHITTVQSLALRPTPMFGRHFIYERKPHDL
ncbi:hypothetical protein POM88_051895 [Heracleum sosnowskyi]|uniref:Uncharacterized protein n=1 Tax=Heracleum sosnowskyi TaxID=360622 RepID=A0AAD8GSU3_9APIA|nr:hypothetical protein POM88_051895 [Heracleum sosnowskyi]